MQPRGSRDTRPSSGRSSRLRTRVAPTPQPWSMPMTHRVFRHAALAAAAGLATLCLAAPAHASSSSLPRLDITGLYVTGVSSSLAAPAHASSSSLPRLDITGLYVTGVSSGGFMATQLQVAYSATFDGAGIIAAGPYDCGQGNVIDFATCDIGASLPALEQQAVTWSHEGLIDPVSDLAGKPIYVYHGTLD